MMRIPPSGRSASARRHELANHGPSSDNEVIEGSGRVTIIMRGAPVSARLRHEIADLRADHPALQGRHPRLVTVQVGDDEAVGSYRTSIDRACQRAEIAYDTLALAFETSGTDLQAVLEDLNRDPEVSGVMVFMPLPPHVDKRVVIDTLSPLKDVDGITSASQGRLRLDLPGLRPSCPLGGMEILDHYGIHLETTDALVVGRSPVVGGPLATMLTHRNATVTVAHRHTADLAAKCRQASLIAVAAGSPGLLTRDMVSSQTIVLDFGTNMVAGALVGDADHDTMEGYVAAISPVPGGTGPVTAATLVRNVVFAAIANHAGSLDLLPRAGTTRPLASGATVS